MLCIAFLLPGSIVNAQDAHTNKENKDAMRRLSFIVGDWKGEGWRMAADGQKNTFIQAETISFKLDSSAILIEGMGTSEGKVIHNAMAVLTYNRSDSNYTFQSYLANGKGGKFKAELLNNRLYWYPNENMRYIIGLNAGGQWYETGEMKQGTDQWFRFFEMTLNRQ